MKQINDTFRFQSEDSSGEILYHRHLIAAVGRPGAIIIRDLTSVAVVYRTNPGSSWGVPGFMSWANNSRNEKLLSKVENIAY